ncbi:MAG: N-methylhydantoinase A [Gammaproteobacteria bacterium]|jgi:N-methylhydantoinase A
MNYHFCFDVGGTFTDMVLLDEASGQFTVSKELTSTIEPAIAVTAGLKTLTRQSNIRPHDITNAVRGATTLITNCLLERSGDKTALITTSGFRDILEIGKEWRYDIYDLFLKMPEPLVPRQLRKGVSERIDHNGDIVQALDLDELKDIVKFFENENVKSIAICFLHSYKNPVHERKARDIVREMLPNVEVCISSEVIPEIREFERCSTAVANAYVLPVARKHFANLRRMLQESGVSARTFIMHSAGGVLTTERAEEIPIRMVESGPAAGVMAGLFYGKAMGISDLVTFDMGGTTCKVALISNDKAHVVNEFEVARVARFKKGSGLPLKIPVLNMVEIGAGGGSIAHIDELGLLKVGPASAGADPGPACYGKDGNDPTVTDADLLLGYLNPDYFLGGNMSLRKDLASNTIQTLAEQLGLSVIETAASINMLVNENMANAARVHLAEEGKDCRRYALLAFGGAGPVHAVDVARRIGISKVISPRAAGVLSAVGLLATPVAFDFVRTFATSLHTLDWTELKAINAELQVEAAELLRDAGVDTGDVEFSRSADMRYQGQGYEITVSIPANILDDESAVGFREAFNDRYNELYNRRVASDLAMEVVNWRLAAKGKPAPLKLFAAEKKSDKKADARKGSRSVYFPSQQAYFDADVYEHDLLTPGQQIAGPAIVEQKESTVVVGPGDKISVDAYLNLIIDLAERSTLPQQGVA